MRKLLLSAFSLLTIICHYFVQTSFAQQPPLQIRLPAAKETTQSINIKNNQWYVVEMESECLAFVSPGESIRLVKETGPIRLRGHFFGGEQKIETRQYAGPHLLIIEAFKNGQDELIIVPRNAKSEQEAKRISFDIKLTDRDRDQDPAPKPDNKPDDKPDDKPKPDAHPQKDAPIMADGLHVLLIYDANAASLPEAQFSMIYGEKIRSQLKQQTVDFRIWPSQTDPANEKAYWRNAFAKPKTSLPWLIISNPQASQSAASKGYEGPLPKTETDFQTLLQKFGAKP